MNGSLWCSRPIASASESSDDRCCSAGAVTASVQAADGSVGREWPCVDAVLELETTRGVEEAHSAAGGSWARDSALISDLWCAAIVLHSLLPNAQGRLAHI